MNDLSKTIDSAIKAPLWFWFAMTLASGIPMFNIARLVEVGIGPDFKLFGVPLALIALTSAALFVASAAARSWGFLVEALEPAWERAFLWLSLKRMSPESRALVHVIEDEDHDEFAYLPDDAVLCDLRDAGCVIASLVADDRSWGHYRLAAGFSRKLMSNQAMVRRTVRSSTDLVEGVRLKMMMANRRANGRA